MDADCSAASQPCAWAQCQVAPGRILTPPPHPRPIPSPHDGEVGRGLGRGDSKERDNSMERAPLPPPSPRSCLAGRGSRRLQRWWVYQDAPATPSATFQTLTWAKANRETNGIANALAWADEHSRSRIEAVFAA